MQIPKTFRTVFEEGHEIGLAEGHEKGLAEGHEKGLAEGHEKGLAEGLAEGRLQEKKAIALILKQSGTPIEIIAQATGLTAEEIQKL